MIEMEPSHAQFKLTRIIYAVITGALIRFIRPASMKCTTNGFAYKTTCA